MMKKEQDVIEKMSKLIKLQYEGLEHMKKLQLHFMVKRVFPEEYKTSIFFIVNALYYKRNFMGAFRANSYEIPKLYNRLSKETKEVLVNTLIIYSLESKTYFEVPRYDQTFDTLTASFSEDKKK